MRIISGRYKGRHIPVRKNFPSRPTTDFAKENLFNILANYFDFEELNVLDLFSGTGSISFEFASRGSKVTSVEINFRSHRFILETAQKLGLDTLTAIKADVFRFLEKSKGTFDIIFADPPYQMKEISLLPDRILKNDILKKEGWLIVEHSDQVQFSGHPLLADHRGYGSVNFSIFKT